MYMGISLNFKVISKNRVCCCMRSLRLSLRLHELVGCYFRSESLRAPYASFQFTQLRDVRH